MPPTDRFVISFAAEPPQDSLPGGDWAETLAEHFLAACNDIDTDGEELGDPGEIRWFPDRTYAGRTYVPATARTAQGFEVFGFVSFVDGGGQAIGPSDFVSRADYTGELAEDNAEWKLDLNDEVIGSWRGEQRKRADMTLVWGLPLIAGGMLVTAELANLAVDQCDLMEDRFTLIAPDNYRGEYIDVKLWGRSGNQLAAESLYVEDDEDEDDGDDEDDDG